MRDSTDALAPSGFVVRSHRRKMVALQSGIVSHDPDVAYNLSERDCATAGLKRPSPATVGLDLEPAPMPTACRIPF
jgi:hypothetical protein